MQLISFSLLALFAASGAFALPAEQGEVAQVAADMTARDVNAAGGSILEARACNRADLPLCSGATHLGEDNCHCKGQVKPCGNWKCGWNGPHSIMNCGSKGNGF